MSLFSQLSVEGTTLYMFGSERPNELIALDLTTGRHRRLATLPKPGWALKLSPDGRSLAIMSFDRHGSYLGVFALATRSYSAVHSLSDNADNQIRPMLAWTSDSREILYLEEDTSSMMFTPESGRQLEFERKFNRGGPGARRSPMVAAQTIRRVAVDGRTPPEDVGVEVKSGRVQEISLTRDGTRLAYGLLTNSRELWSMDISDALRRAGK